MRHLVGVIALLGLLISSVVGAAPMTRLHPMEPKERGQKKANSAVAAGAGWQMDGFYSSATEASSTIDITSVPPYGVDGFIHGTVTGVDFSMHRVAPYIQVEGLGWYTKPTFANPTVPINSDGSFTADVATGGIDNRATIYCVALISDDMQPPPANGTSRIPSNLDSVAIDCQERYGKVLDFAGLRWAVKEAPVGVGPGQNHFSDHPKDVFVDSSGHLHLTVKFHDGFWWATEVILLDGPRGFGTYAFQTASRLDVLDANVTFGAFIWDPYGDEETVPGSLHREIDFEDSRWGASADPMNAQAVVQPFGVTGNLHRYTIPNLGVDPALTRFFTWRPNRIDFVALSGHLSPFSYPSGSVIDQFSYIEDAAMNHFVPTTGRESFRFNLWPNNVELGGVPPPRPADGQPVEVVITDFRFMPLVRSTPFDFEADGKTDLATWRPREGNWYIVNSATSTFTFTIRQWGLPGDKPGPGDYDGDGKTDMAIWRPSQGNWYVINSSTNTSIVYQWGLQGDIPVPGDYDGDGKTDLAVWRPVEGNWYIVFSSTGMQAVAQWGLPDDIPVPSAFFR